MVGYIAVINLNRGNYGYEATKPLTLPHEFTLRIRNWAVKPYVDIKVQPSPCQSPYEPLFTRFWNGTEQLVAPDSCYENNEGDCITKEVISRN